MDQQEPESDYKKTFGRFGLIGIFVLLALALWENPSLSGSSPGIHRGGILWLWAFPLAVVYSVVVTFFQKRKKK